MSQPKQHYEIIKFKKQQRSKKCKTMVEAIQHLRSTTPEDCYYEVWAIRTAEDVGELRSLKCGLSLKNII